MESDRERLLYLCDGHRSCYLVQDTDDSDGIKEEISKLLLYKKEQIHKFIFYKDHLYWIIFLTSIRWPRFLAMIGSAIFFSTTLTMPQFLLSDVKDGKCDIKWTTLNENDCEHVLKSTSFDVSDCLYRHKGYTRSTSI